MMSLVFGGSGFIGRHLVQELSLLGGEVVVADIAPPSQEVDFPVLNIDVRDASGVAAAVRDADVVYDCAGLLGTDELFDNVREAVAVNVGGLVNVLEACRQYHRPLVYITLINNWLNPYTITKQAGSQFCEMYRREFDLAIATVGALNAYGEWQHARELDGISPRKFAPSFIVRALRGESLDIFGNGEQEIDAIYAGDVARLMVRVAGLSGIYEAGMGKGVTVNAIARKILELTGSNSDIVYLPRRRGEPEQSRTVADNLKSALATGWKAMVSLDEGLRRTIEYYRRLLDREGRTLAGIASVGKETEDVR